MILDSRLTLKDIISLFNHHFSIVGNINQAMLIINMISQLYSQFINKSIYYETERERERVILEGLFF